MRQTLEECQCYSLDIDYSVTDELQIVGDINIITLNLITFVRRHIAKLYFGEPWQRIGNFLELANLLTYSALLSLFQGQVLEWRFY